MYLSQWEDVKVYPRAAEGAVLLLVVLSLAHALREVRVSERVSGGVVRGRWRWRALSVWLSLLLVAGSWELYSALLLPKWHPVCYPKSLIMLSNCHSLWGSLRHVPLAYMSWAVGRHEKYTAAPLSFVACFLFLFYSLSFECFALSNNLLRYNHKVKELDATIFFRVPALVVAMYTGAGLCLSLTPVSDSCSEAVYPQKHNWFTALLKFFFSVLRGAAGVTMGGVAMALVSLWLSQQVDLHMSNSASDYEHNDEQVIEDEEDEYIEYPELPEWTRPPPQASMCLVVPALVLGVLLFYFACYFSSPKLQSLSASHAPDKFLFAMSLIFFGLLDGTVLLRAVGLDGTEHAATSSDALDDVNNLHVDLATPAHVFLFINSLLALWTNVAGCSLLTPSLSLSNKDDSMNELEDINQHDD